MFSIKNIAGLLLVLVVLMWGMGGLTDIEPGEVGLKVIKIGTERGMSKETLDTGIHWIEPFSTDVAVYDTRHKQYSLKELPATTKDGQPILVDLSIEMGLVDALVPNLHETVGRDYYEQVVYPAIRSMVRNTTTTELSDNIYTGAGRAAIQKKLTESLHTKLSPLGMDISVNLRSIQFQNAAFVNTLERKAGAQQKVEIAKRDAAAAVHAAKAVENQAEGEKQKRIKAAEAEKEEIRLKGLGQKLAKIEEAKGNLALAKAKAEGTRLQVKAYGSGKTYASVKWAENLSPKLRVYAFPTGAPGTTSLMDLNGVLKGAFKVQGAK